MSHPSLWTIETTYKDYRNSIHTDTAKLHVARNVILVRIQDLVLSVICMVRSKNHSAEVYSASWFEYEIQTSLNLFTMA